MSPSSAGATRANRAEGFGRTSRIYSLPDGRQLPSVTTILSAINKPALVNWSAKVEREAIYAAVGQLWDDVPKDTKMNRMAFLATLADRVGTEKANQKIKNKAGDIGSEIHALAEWTLRKELKQEVGPRPAACEQAEWGFMAWEDWRKASNLVPLRIEQTIWSDKHGYAGSFDLYCEMELPTGDRGRVLIDWKSGKGIYSEAHLQIAAYVEALIEMQHADRPLHGMILRVPKVIGDPNFETKFIDASSIAGLHKVFLHVFELWRWMEKGGTL